MSYASATDNGGFSIPQATIPGTPIGPNQPGCNTCPVPPLSSAQYTRTRTALYGPPIVESEVVDRCTGAVVSQKERMDVHFTTSQWTLDSNASNVHPSYNKFVAQTFHTA